MDERLRGCYLGVADGLSDEELAEGFPEVWERLERWRRGRLPYLDLAFPEGESAEEFVMRVNAALIDWDATRRTDVALFVSRSVAIAIKNLLDGKDLPDFQRVAFHPGSISKWSEGRWAFINSTRHLPPRRFALD